jgi:transcriptional regulator EpsA
MDIQARRAESPRLRTTGDVPADPLAAQRQPLMIHPAVSGIVQEPPVPPPGAGAEDFAPASSGIFQGYDGDEVLLNIDASLRVHTRPHFFSWTQGLLQSLIRHRILICVLPTSAPDATVIDSFSMDAMDSSRFSGLFGAGGAGHQLVKTWTARRYRPVSLDASGIPGEPVWQREFDRIGVSRLCGHGMHDSRGAMASFFLFGCEADAGGGRYASAMELVVPFLHAAWVRTRMHSALHEGTEPGPRPDAGGLTEREREILRWIYFGKSNFEIGAILGISPLTVKNHVQKILRKLNVVNRAQAVGKALERRVIEP